MPPKKQQPHDRAGHPEAAARVVLPGVPGAPPHGRAGAGLGGGDQLGQVRTHGPGRCGRTGGGSVAARQRALSRCNPILLGRCRAEAAASWTPPRAGRGSARACVQGPVTWADERQRRHGHAKQRRVLVAATRRSDLRLGHPLVSRQRRRAAPEYRANPAASRHQVRLLQVRRTRALSYLAIFQLAEGAAPFS